METRLTCQGRSCHYLRVGRKPETLMAKCIILTTLTRLRAGSTPETGKRVCVCDVVVLMKKMLTFDLLQMLENTPHMSNITEM